jgi:hypothetical protein
MEDNRKPGLNTTGAGTLAPVNPSKQSVSPDQERSIEDRESLRKLGLELVIQLFSASKTIRLYNMNNRATQRALTALNEAVQQLLEAESHASIHVSGDLLLINECRIAVDAQHYGPFEYIVDELKKRQVATVEFNAGINPGELGIFLKTFFSVDPVENAYEILQKEMTAASISCVSTSFLEEVEQELRDKDENRRDLREESNRVYFRTVALMGDVLRTIEEKHILQEKGQTGDAADG